MTISISQKIKSIELVKDEKPVKEIIKEMVSRPKELDGKTYKLKSPLTENAIYITINHIVIDQKKYPFEIFINTKSLENQQWIITLTRLISAIFRQHTTFHNDITFMIRELKSVFDPSGGYISKNRKIPSLVAEIGDVIEKHLIGLGTITDITLDRYMTVEEIENKIKSVAATHHYKECPECGNFSMISVDGCGVCTVCGYSKC